MKRLFPITLSISLALVLLFLVFSGVRAESAVPVPDRTPADATIADPVTVITVTSGTDPDTSKSTTCYSGTAQPPCTLRRAIVEARLLPPEARPVKITFNIPADPSEGYNAALKIWKIHVLATTDPSVFRTLEGGQIQIDGSTQPGGRTNGPSIMIVGPTTGQKDGIIVGVNTTGDHDDNVIRGLGFQNFKTHVIVNSNNNLIEDNWFGLADDGQSPFLRGDNPEDGSGSSGVALSDGVAGSLIQNNVFLGLDGTAATLRGENNTFASNLVGTAADGLVPGKQTAPDLNCTPVDWLGGGGLTIEGPGQIVENNVFAGLRQQIFVMSTQPSAVYLIAGCQNSIIRNNRIGLDIADNPIGVCGRGIYMSDSPQNVQVLNNTIYETGLSAITLNGVFYNANLLRGNTVEKRFQWTQVEGNAKPESAIQLGTSLPDPFEFFKPAKVTSIQGTAVNGTQGEGNPCPNCVIEIFLDDTDVITEALQSLAVVTADANGNWTATLPFELEAGQGLRTTSTTAAYNTIPNIHAGTTSGLSELYIGGYKLHLPLMVK